MKLREEDGGGEWRKAEEGERVGRREEKGGGRRSIPHQKWGEGGKCAKDMQE